MLRRRSRRRCVAHDDGQEEAVAAPVRGADHPLGAAGVTDGVARGLDPGRQRRLTDEPIAPDAVEQLDLGHDAVAVLHEQTQDVEHLRLDMTRLPAPAQLEAAGVELELVELEDHAPMMACPVGRRHRP